MPFIFPPDFKPVYPNLTANGTTQATATQTLHGTNQFITVVLGGAAILPPAVGNGRSVVIQDIGANTLTVFTALNTTDLIDKVASRTLNAGQIGIFIDVAAGNWVSIRG